MELAGCKERANRFLSGKRSGVFVVDTGSRAVLKDLKEYYTSRSDCDAMSISSFAFADELPKNDELYHAVAQQGRSVILTGISAYLFLRGREQTKKILKVLLDMEAHRRVVVITFGCSERLNELINEDPRRKDNIAFADGEGDRFPRLVLVGNDFVPYGSHPIEGLNNAFEAAEKSTESELYVLTGKTKADFPRSLIELEDRQNARKVVEKLDALVVSLDRSWGTDEQWKYVYDRLAGKHGLRHVMDTEFGNDLESFVHFFGDYDDNRKWLYVTGLKLFGSQFEILNKAAETARKPSELVGLLYESILEYDSSDAGFDDIYKNRKDLLKHLKADEADAGRFCCQAEIKGRDYIYYLTDITEQERNLVYKWLEKYGSDLSPAELKEVLLRVYPALAEYMHSYDLGSDLLNKYFDDYKYQKLINCIRPEFYDLVKEQAQKRDYNKLAARSYVIDKIDRQNSVLYFADALGAEFVGYMALRCKDMGLKVKVNICRGYLPTITSCNKDFISEFAEYHENRELDKIKHDGGTGFDYTKNTLPIHLSAELEVIDRLLVAIKTNLQNDRDKRAVIASDHGASRLAVLFENEILLEMGTKGEHSGRCCPKSEIAEKPDFAAEENGFWVLANYDRFRGGRKAAVEVHGGASLEETAVPVFELQLQQQPIEVKLYQPDGKSGENNIPAIKASFRIKPELKIYTSEKSEVIRLFVNGRYYTAERMEDHLSRVVLDGLKKGDYTADVYCDGGLAASGLRFKVTSGAGAEKDLL